MGRRACEEPSEERIAGLGGFVALATATTIGLSDALLALSAEPRRLDSLSEAGLPFTLLVLLALVVLVPAMLVLGRLLAHRSSTAAVALAAATAAIVGFVLMWMCELNRVSTWTSQTTVTALRGGFVAGVALLAASGAHAYALRSRLDQRAVLRVAAILMFLLAAATAIRIGSVLGPESGDWIRWGLIAAAPGILLLFAWGSSRRLAGVLTAAAVVLLTGAICATPWASRPSHTEPKADSPPPGAPPIVMITIDTLRRDALTCYNRAGAGTPHLDKLAGDGVRFGAAYSAGPWTIPALVSIMTGVAADVHAVNHDFAAIPEQFETLADRLRGAGYRTAAVGEHPQLARMGRGFEHFDFTPRSLPFHPLMTGGRLLWRLFAKSHGTDDLPDLARIWLETYGGETFFLWVHFLDPHGPYTPPVRFLPESPLLERYGNDSLRVRMPDVRAGRAIVQRSEREWLRLLYDAEVRWVDESVGRLLDHLAALDLYDRSLIVVLSDHGEEFWDHGGFEHGHSLYDELVRVPLLIKPPGLRVEGVVEKPISTAALTPTLLELAGVASPLAQGEPSFAHLLRNEPAQVSIAPIVLGGVEYFEPRVGVVLDGHKYIRGLDSGREELYPLADDTSGERRSVLGERPAVAERARNILASRSPRETRAPTVAPIPPAIEAELQALGYVE